MFFIGIDLAWSEKNSSGVAVLEGDVDGVELKVLEIVKGDEDIINLVKDYKEGLISIDAPLIVPNEEGRRIAEVKVGELFRKYNAGAHPTNRRRLSSWTGKIRGEEISKKLEELGFQQDPYIKKYEKVKKFVEVYPHPSMVVLFNLGKVIPYKAKPKRDYELRWRAFEEYQNNLKGLKDLVLPRKVFEDVRNLRAQKLKDYEDKLDAIFCAYLSYYFWKFPERCEVLGNMEEGYILTPVFGFMKSQKLIKGFIP